jgi:hypothetical protein
VEDDDDNKYCKDQNILRETHNKSTGHHLPNFSCVHLIHSLELLIKNDSLDDVSLKMACTNNNFLENDNSMNRSLNGYSNTGISS